MALCNRSASLPRFISFIVLSLLLLQWYCLCYFRSSTKYSFFLQWWRFIISWRFHFSFHFHFHSKAMISQNQVTVYQLKRFKLRKRISRKREDCFAITSVSLRKGIISFGVENMYLWIWNFSFVVIWCIYCVPALHFMLVKAVECHRRSASASSWMIDLLNAFHTPNSFSLCILPH